MRSAVDDLSPERVVGRKPYVIAPQETAYSSYSNESVEIITSEKIFAWIAFFMQDPSKVLSPSFSIFL